MTTDETENVNLRTTSTCTTYEKLELRNDYN